MAKSSHLHISAAKLGRLDAAACDRLMSSLAEFMEREQVADDERVAAQAIHFNGLLPEYFEQKTFREILLARRYFLQHPLATPSESLVFAALLHILHGNRPYALSRRLHPITPFAPTEEFEYRALMPRLRDKVARSLAVTYPKEFAPGQAVFQDATAWWPQEVDRLDAIITSPPFFDSTRFYLANWMRLWFCGWEAVDFRIRPLAFVDERPWRELIIRGFCGTYERVFLLRLETKVPDKLTLHWYAVGVSLQRRVRRRKRCATSSLQKSTKRCVPAAAIVWPSANLTRWPW